MFSEIFQDLILQYDTLVYAQFTRNTNKTIRRKRGSDDEEDESNESDWTPTSPVDKQVLTPL